MGDDWEAVVGHIEEIKTLLEISVDRPPKRQFQRDLEALLARYARITDDIELLIEIQRVANKLTSIDLGRLGPEQRARLEEDKARALERLRHMGELRGEALAGAREEFARISRNVANWLEDANGLIRTYVRIRPGGAADSAALDTRGNSVQVSCDPILRTNATSESYGPFYGVFTGSERDLFGDCSAQSGGAPAAPPPETRVCSVVDQLLSGYSVMLWGYGQSGSGKTRTLLGEPGVDGLIHLTFDRLSSRGASIDVDCVFELACASFQPEDPRPGLPRMQGQLITLFSRNARYDELVDRCRGERPKDFKTFPKTNQEAIDHIMRLIGSNAQRIENVPGRMRTRADIARWLDAIEAARMNAQPPSAPRIFATVNNDKSSRSHLFTVLKVTAPKSEDPAYLTIVDMGGREDPVDMLDRLLSNPKDLPFKTIYRPESLARYGPLDARVKTAASLELKTHPFSHDIVQNFQATLDSSFYINETINHMLWFIKRSINAQIETKPIAVKKGFNDFADDYNPEKTFWINPKGELRLTGKSEFGHCLMIPVLEFLTTLGGSGKPFKFVMICCARRERALLDVTIRTLRFAESVASTSYEVGGDKHACDLDRVKKESKYARSIDAMVRAVDAVRDEQRDFKSMDEVDVDRLLAPFKVSVPWYAEGGVKMDSYIAVARRMKLADLPRAVIAVNHLNITDLEKKRRALGLLRNLVDKKDFDTRTFRNVLESAALESNPKVEAVGDLVKAMEFLSGRKPPNPRAGRLIS